MPEENNQSLVKTSVTLNRECEELISSWMEERAGFAPSIFSTPKSEISVISIYQPGESPDILQLQELSQYIKSLSHFGLKPGDPEFTQEIVDKEDWAEVWKNHFKTIEIEDSLWIRPSWEEPPPSPQMADIVIDPGLSFGTGQHATTSYCLRKLASLRKENPNLTNILDAGTGSGILSIAAKKLGYLHVEAFDYDPDAIKCAIENATNNGVSLPIFQAELGTDISELEKKQNYFDFIVANILAETLLANIDDLIGWLKPGGYLSVAGILVEQFDEIIHHFTEKGLVFIDSFPDGEWQSGTFKKPIK